MSAEPSALDARTASSEREIDQLRREKEQLLSQLEAFGNAGKRFEAPTTAKQTCKNRFPLLLVLVVNQVVYAWNAQSVSSTSSMSPAGVALVNQIMVNSTYFLTLPHGKFSSCDCQAGPVLDAARIVPHIGAVVLFALYAFKPPGVCRRRSVYAEMTTFSFSHVSNKCWLSVFVLVAISAGVISTYFIGPNHNALLVLIWGIIYTQCHEVVVASINATPDRSGINGLKQQLIDEARKLASDPHAVEMELK